VKKKIFAPTSAGDHSRAYCGRKPLPPALLRFAGLVIAALALQGLPLIFLSMEGEGAVALYLIHLYGLIPLCAFLIPLWAGLGGVHPFAGFFPVGGALLLLPVYESPVVGLICLLLSLVGCAAGQEWKKRRETVKGNHHGKGNKQGKK